MLFSSLLLLLGAAGLHAISNALMKQATDKLAFVWWMLGIFTVAALPSLFFIHDIPLRAWIIVLSSGILEAVYFLTLSRAYEHGDLSVVYPVARGSAQIFILIWAILFIGEHPSQFGLLGIFAIICGLYIINLPSISDWKRPLLGMRQPATRWALLTGFLISGYSAIDKMGVRYFPPFVYLFLILLVCWIVLSVQWLNQTRRTAIVNEVTPLRKIKWVLVSSILGTVAYLLVLLAMRRSPVSYVGPVREVSVVIGAWIGIRFMSERGGRSRIAASMLVAGGILLIAFGG